MVSYSATHKLALNASKTQLLWSSRGIGNPSVLKIGATEVSSADTLEMLGVAYDRALTSAPYRESTLNLGSCSLQCMKQTTSQI